jgi:hypothetical protein
MSEKEVQVDWRPVEGTLLLGYNSLQELSHCFLAQLNTTLCFEN